jgi:hypothetical protein
VPYVNNLLLTMVNLLEEVGLNSKGTMSSKVATTTNMAEITTERTFMALWMAKISRKIIQWIADLKGLRVIQENMLKFQTDQSHA